MYTEIINKINTSRIKVKPIFYIKCTNTKKLLITLTEILIFTPTENFYSSF